MAVGDIADGLARGAEGVGATISEAFFEPVVRLGVTGLSRAGKTVFITSLVANLLDRGRMPQLRGAREGAIRAAWLQPQPDMRVPRFDFEGHMAALTADTPRWPASTRAVSELRLSFRVQPGGIFGGLRGRVAGPRVVHLDIVDYPGEWLLDLALLDLSYADWSRRVLARMANRPQAAQALAELRAADSAAPYDEARTAALTDVYTRWLRAARDAGFSDCTPGRFLLPGDLDGAPVLSFVPLPDPGRVPRRGSLWREMERRFEAYKREVVKPFFREHFARIDRQVVLADVLEAIHSGPQAFAELGDALTDTLGAFRAGGNAWLSRLLRGRRVDRLLFVATKADHLHHVQHARLGAITEALLRSASDRAAFAGAQTAAMAVASLRATVEETVAQNGETLECVRGTLADGGRQVAFYPGELPDDPARLLGPARDGAPAWPDGEYDAMRFAPPRLRLRPGDGPPHIRLDRAAEFLIGDRLR